MLQKINGRPSRACMPLKEAKFPAPFAPTLEYSVPARGTWNIVHTGMILPESHQIYIGATGCLRGVVLTAAEMGAMDRYSAVEVKEKDLIVADQENFIVEGVADIIRRLPQQPRAVLVFTTCMHHFMGTDLKYVYRRLSERFPVIDFAPCIMDPIMSRTGLTPEARERREIFRLLRPQPQDGGVNLIGNNLPLDDSSELVKLVGSAGRHLRDWTRCRDYAEFQKMAKSAYNIYYHPSTHAAARDLVSRLGQKFLYLPLSYDFAEIEDNLRFLAQILEVNLPDYGLARELAQNSLAAAKEIIGAAPVAIDASFTFRPFNLARVLSEHGFNVRQIYADVVPTEDEADFRRLQSSCGDIELMAIKHADLNLHRRGSPLKTLAMGQKAAYFNDTPYFVNFVEGGGHYGFDGIARLGDLMREAWQTPRDTRTLIQRKGWGGACCL